MREDSPQSKTNHEIGAPSAETAATIHSATCFTSEHANESINMLMREDDAEMLELGVENSSVPPTPYAGPDAGPDSSIKVSSPPSIDIGESAISVSIVLNDLQVDLHSERDTCSEATSSASVHQTINASGRNSPNARSKNTTEDISAFTERIEVGLINHNKRRQLVDGTPPNIEETSFHSVCGDGECERAAKSPQESALESNNSPSQHFPDLISHHSKTYHRRLHEAAQFAEAVGEPQDGMIQVIIDDDDDDESDDDSDSPTENDETEDIAIDNEIAISGVLQIESKGDVLKEGSAEMSSIEHEEIVGVRLEQCSSFAQQEIAGLQPSFVPTYNDEGIGKGKDVDILNFDESFTVEESFLVNIEERCMSPQANRTGRFPSERSVSDGNLVQLDKQEKDQLADYPLRKRSASYQYFRHKLPLEDDVLNHESNAFKGIVSPEVTKRGILRGNYAQLHRKAWLEVSDKYHRYGKNLRTYYKHWEKLGHPTNMFFDWLDVKGEAAGWELPNLPECPREQLDNDCVTYITDPKEQAKYLLKIVPQEKKSLHEGAKVPCKIVDLEGNPARTGPNGWIFVLRDHELYGAEKRIKGENGVKHRFHHSSFFGGKAVAAAGIIITDDHGYLTRLYPHSGKGFH